MWLYNCSSAVGSLKTIFAQRLFGENGDIKVNMMPTAAILPIVFLQHITMVFTLVVVFVHRGCSAVNMIGKEAVLPRANAQIVSNGTVSCITFHTGTVKT